MELYYHKTEGGAEYLCTTYVECPNGHKEGTFDGFCVRIDGRQLELYPQRLKDAGYKTLKIGNVTINLIN